MTEVRDNPSLNRFELDVDGHMAIAVYRRQGDTLLVHHTETPTTLRGRGIGSRLVQGLLDNARARGLKVAPLCPFVRVYMDEHPEYADVRG